MLEIGVCHHGSLAPWRKLLSTEARLYGIDINRQCASYGGDNAIVRIGSQSDPDFLRSVVDNQFFDGLAAVRKRRQLPRFHVKIPEHETVD